MVKLFWVISIKEYASRASERPWRQRRERSRRRPHSSPRRFGFKNVGRVRGNWYTENACIFFVGCSERIRETPRKVRNAPQSFSAKAAIARITEVVWWPWCGAWSRHHIIEFASLAVSSTSNHEGRHMSCLTRWQCIGIRSCCLVIEGRQ